MRVRGDRLPGMVMGLLLAGTSIAVAQSIDPLARERADFSTWLTSAPLSPYAAVAVQPIGPGISVGPDPADIPLADLDRGRVQESPGGAVLVQGATRTTLARGRPVPVGPYRMLVDGATGRRLLVVYGPVRGAKPPAYYPANPRLRFNVELTAPTRRGAFPTLGLDGIETRAEEAGRVAVTIGPSRTELRVYRMGAAEDEEAELLVFFRDSTNAHGTYPAGRFVPLEFAGQRGRYVLDFNRARNPFCAYSTVFPCPAPWPGNTLPTAVNAGERYEPTH